MIYNRHKEFNNPEGYRAGKFVDLSATVADAIVDLIPHREKFDVVVCRGISGLTVASPVALTLGKDLAVLRKPYDHYKPLDHADALLVPRAELLGIPEVKGKKALFLDDFIASGNTAHLVEEAVLHHKGKIVMAYLYAEREVRDYA